MKTTLGAGVAAEAEKKAEESRANRITVTLYFRFISRCLLGSLRDNNSKHVDPLRLDSLQLVGRQGRIFFGGPVAVQMGGRCGIAMALCSTGCAAGETTF
jgi:hypothetical protein